MHHTTLPEPSLIPPAAAAIGMVQLARCKRAPPFFYFVSMEPWAWMINFPSVVGGRPSCCDALAPCDSPRSYVESLGKDIETIDNSLTGSLSAVTSSLAKFAASITAEHLDIGVLFSAKIDSLLNCSECPSLLHISVVIGGFRSLLPLVWPTTGRGIRRMGSNPLDNSLVPGALPEGTLTAGPCIPNIAPLAICTATPDGTTKMSYNFWMMAAPQRYFDPLRTGQSGPLRCSRSLYMLDLELLVFMHVGSGLLSSSSEVYLDLLREPQPSSSAAVHPRTNKKDAVSVNCIILELITYGVYALQHADTTWNPIWSMQTSFDNVWELVSWEWVHENQSPVIVTLNGVKYVDMTHLAVVDICRGIGHPW
ncbi:hypothetical protein BU15DRAFT_78092 [Melanogaster broomeanus]|nr:hypothetical protein BU15DRAFT_78092 [Melanogaster broomeanus]